MKRLGIAAAILSMSFLSAARSQTLSPVMQLASCGGVTGLVPGRGNVDLYDGPNIVATVAVPQNNNFNWTVPAAWQTDGKYHVISAAMSGTHNELIGSPESFTCSTNPPAAYQYTVDTGNPSAAGGPFNNYTAAQWTANGSNPLVTSYGFVNTFGSLIYNGAILPQNPGESDSTQYEISTTLTLQNGTGSYIHYIHATANAQLYGPSGAVGTFHALELKNVAIDNDGNCSALLVSWDVQNGSATMQASLAVPCSPTSTLMRTVVFNLPASNITKVWTLVDGQLFSTSTAIASGQPGVGVNSYNGGFSRGRIADGESQRADGELWDLCA